VPAQTTQGVLDVSLNPTDPASATARRVSEDSPELQEWFREAITALHAEHLGRAVLPAVTTPQGRWDETVELIGYVLPLDADNTQHLHLFVTGDMFVSEPASNTAGIGLREYQDQYTPSLVPVRVDVSRDAPAGDVSRYIENLRLTREGANVRVIYVNSEAADVSDLESAVRTAIGTARRRRADRESARKRTMSALVEGVLDLTTSLTLQSAPQGAGPVSEVVRISDHASIQRAPVAQLAPSAPPHAA
jgi:hypothetical protein